LIHFRIDCTVGGQHGRLIGDYAVKRANADGAQ
jgi:hypothetical protein